MLINDDSRYNTEHNSKKTISKFKYNFIPVIFVLFRFNVDIEN